MLKKVSRLAIIIIILLLLAVWAPWEKYDLTIAGLLGISEPKKYAGLEVSSLKDTLRLYVDGEERGEVSSEGGILEIPQIEPGSHIIRLEKVSETEGFYHSIMKTVDFAPEFNVVLAYELGPGELFSQGHILYAKEGINKDQNPRLNIVVDNIENVEVWLDGQEIGKTPIEGYDLSLDKVHTLKLVKTGYEELEFTILPEAQEDRDKLKGVDLFIDALLFWEPIEVN